MRTPLTDADFAAMEGDPLREAGYYSDRARYWYFRLRAARLRTRRAKGFNIDAEAFSPEKCDAMAEILNGWAADAYLENSGFSPEADHIP